MLISLTFAVFSFFSIHQVSANSKVKLIEVTAITLYKDRKTTGRRNSPIPQLSCVGGSAGCGAHVPEVVQCYNRGNDGLDVQWECKADMPNAYKFGRVEVLCEGYDYPDDPYILKGSCGLEYTIDNTDAGTANQGHDGYSYKQPKKSSTIADILFWVIIALFLFFLYKTFVTPAGRLPGRSGGGAGGGGFDGGPPPPPGFRPDTHPDDSCHRPNFGSSSQGTAGMGAGGAGGPGFWTGMGAGGLLGYLFGNRGGNYGGGGYGGGYYSPGPSYGRSGGGFSSGGFGSGGASTSHSSSGYGGTRRR